MYQNTASAYNIYFDNSINTASPEKLTLMLYEGVVKFCRFAEIAIQEGNIKLRHTNLIKAQNIVKELMINVNKEAGEIADQFLMLYDFIQLQLVEANVENNCEKIKVARELMEELSNTWAQIV
ncbi:MAG: flagellar export chaperone FliS [Peptostreptococcales bacterium]